MVMFSIVALFGVYKVTYNVIQHHMFFQYIDSADLESSTLQEEPVKYHEAWQKLCSAE